MFAGNKARACMLLALLFISPMLAAGIVSSSMTNGKNAFADYRKGEADKPALLLLHGFLQTHEFGLIQSLATELTDSGYTVLAPTLSLDIEQRKKPLSCSAIHTHHFQDTVNEIDRWVSWLHQQGHSHIILISHSSSGITLADYTRHQPHPSVRRSILLSLGTFLRGDRLLKNHEAIAEARAHLSGNSEQLHKYTIGFCSANYLSPPRAIISYFSWDQARILAALQKSQVPTTIILGGADNYLPAGWQQTLQSHGLDIRIVDGADHFFSGTHEFELFDAVYASIKP